MWYYGFEKSSLFTPNLIFSQFRMDYGRIYWSGIFLNQFKSLILVENHRNLIENLKKIALHHVSELRSGLSFQIRRIQRVQFQKNGTSSRHVSCIIEFHTTETRIYEVMNYFYRIVFCSYGFCTGHILK